MQQQEQQTPTPAAPAADALSPYLLQATAVQAAAPAASSYKKSDFELYTLTTWLLQVRSLFFAHPHPRSSCTFCIRQ
jgi:hypothetical protein